METTLTLSFPPHLVWGTLGLLGIALASALVFVAMPKESNARDRLTDMRDKLGLRDFPVMAFLVTALVWTGLAYVLTTGLIGLILNVITDTAPNRDAPSEVWEFRFKLVQITALTTVLGAVIALPITMSRLRLTRKQTDTATEALFNDKMTAATTDLYSRRQTANGGGWQDDVPRRNSAIDRLEGLVSERPDAAPRVARLLSVYIRELSGPDEVPAQTHGYIQARKLMHPDDDNRPLSEQEALEHLNLTPDDITLDALQTWARNLTPRSDMENAVQSLGRLRGMDGVDADKVEIDLRGANLQGIAFEAGNFDAARLNGAQLQGANLSWAQFDDATALSAATLRGAAVKKVDLTTVPQIADDVADMFGDASVILPPDVPRPDHWPEVELDWSDFQTRWRAWQATLPPGWDK